MREEEVVVLQRQELFHGVSRQEIPPLLHCLEAAEKSYQKGEFISCTEDTIRWIGIILKGSVRMVKTDWWGNNTILASMNQDEIFGESFACGSRKQSFVSFQAAEETKVLFLQFDKVLHTCSKVCTFHQKLTENMVSVIAHKNLCLMEKIEITSKKTLREKVYTYLCNQAQIEESAYITIPMGRMELAEYLGVDRSALSRELKNMKEQGIIDFHKDTFRILGKFAD